MIPKSTFIHNQKQQKKISETLFWAGTKQMEAQLALSKQKMNNTQSTK